jgi:hypothetical protein
MVLPPTGSEDTPGIATHDHRRSPSKQNRENEADLFFIFNKFPENEPILEGAATSTALPENIGGNEVSCQPLAAMQPPKGMKMGGRSGSAPR